MATNWEAMLVKACVAAVILWVTAGIVSDGFRSDGSENPAASGPIAASGNRSGGDRWNGTVAGPRVATMIPVAAPAGGDPGTGRNRNYVDPDIQIAEAHWQGMDVVPLTDELKRKLRYPMGLDGLLIDEVTLGSAAAGLLAGDVITAVGDAPVTTLKEFQQQTRTLRSRRRGSITVLRKGAMMNDGRFAMSPVALVLAADQDLGFAQLEGAPMILPGDGRPHSYRGPCTQCHAIGVGFELTPDPDLITLPPPSITIEAANEGRSPHRNRGPCSACHTITR